MHSHHGSALSNSRSSFALVVIAFAAVAAGAIATRGFGAFGGGSPSDTGVVKSPGSEKLAAADAESQSRCEAAEAARQLLEEPVRSARNKPIPEPDAHEIKPHPAPKYYGEARASHCTEDKGYHGTPYEPQVLYFFDTCHGRLTGVAYDRANQLFYMVQYEAARIDPESERYPVVPVFKIKDVQP